MSAQAGITGRVVSADGTSPEGTWVFVRSASHRDSIPVGRSGRFVVAWPDSVPEDTVEVLVDVLDPAGRIFLPSLARIPAGDLAGEHRFVLVPGIWTIAAGRYTGSGVPISMQRAFEPACDECSAFYIQASPFGAAGQRSKLQMWPDSQFPLRVAFDRERSGHRITARDSVAFWRVAEQIEADFGRDLFRPARYEETLARDEENEPEDVILVWVDPTLPFAGIGIAVSEGAKIIYGAVRFKEGSVFTDSDGASLISHEMVHALGFGHTCSWRSVTAQTRYCPGLRADGATPEDIAYAEVLRAVNLLQLAHEARWGIDAVLAGERRVNRPVGNFRPVAPARF